MAEPVRLQRYLATAGIAARRKAEDLITAGRVQVNGKVVKVLGTKVDPSHDEVQVDGEAVVALDRFYVLLNKPKACITAVTDDRGRPTVMDYLPNVPVPVKPVGRLDFYTEGVLLLTNDGELAAKLLAPASHVPKTYHVKVHGQLSRDEIQALRDGVTLDDGVTTMPAEVEILPGESKHTWLGITIHEGKHRQIHRMIEALGYQVDKLQRVAFANLTFHNLRVGDARELTQLELNELRDTVGLDHSAVARGKWSADREQTDIPRRARAKARAEAEEAMLARGIDPAAPRPARSPAHSSSASDGDDAWDELPEGYEDDSDTDGAGGYDDDDDSGGEAEAPQLARRSAAPGARGRDAGPRSREAGPRDAGPRGRSFDRDAGPRSRGSDRDAAPRGRSSDRDAAPRGRGNGPRGGDAGPGSRGPGLRSAGPGGRTYGRGDGPRGRDAGPGSRGPGLRSAGPGVRTYGRDAGPRGRDAGPGSRGPSRSFDRDAGPRGAGPRGAGPRGAGPRGAGPRGAGPGGAGPRGRDAGPGSRGPSRGFDRDASPRGAGPRGAGPRGAGPRGATPRGRDAAPGSRGPSFGPTKPRAAGRPASKRSAPARSARPAAPPRGRKR